MTNIERQLYRPAGAVAIFFANNNRASIDRFNFF